MPASMNAWLSETFLALVRIASESGEEHELLDHLRELFDRSLGASCGFDSFGNLIARIPAKNSSCGVPLFFGCHADTVRPGKNVVPVIREGVVRSNGDTILGADDKAGIAELAEAIRTAQRHPPLEIVISREEELGLVGAKHVDASQLKSKKGFVIDAGSLATVVVGGPSYIEVDVEVTGKAAHAGMAPEMGVSAVKAACCAVAILKDGRIDGESTINVGMISGGEVRNGVPAKARISAECRSLSDDKCWQNAELMKEVFQAAARVQGASAEVKLEQAYRAMQVAEDAEVVRLAFRAIQAEALEATATATTGGTDASIYNDKGIQTVVIGYGGQGEHSSQESIALSDLEKGARIIRNILTEASA